MLEKILRYLFPRIFESIENLAYNKGWRARTQEDENFRKFTKEQAVTEWLNKPVIFFGNEWEDPIIGIAFKVVDSSVFNTNEPMVKVYDYITNKTFYTWTSSLLYADMKMIYAILRLNPFERWNIRSRMSVNVWEKSYPNRPVKTEQEIMDCLHKNGFWDNVKKITINNKEVTSR